MAKKTGGGGIGGATGFVLHIDDELINKLNTADQKIQDLAKHSEESRDRIVNAFKAMGDNGVGYLITKLTEAQTRLDNLTGKSVNIDVKGLDNISAAAGKSTDNVNQLLSAIVALADANSKLSTNVTSLTAQLGSLKTNATGITKDLDKLAQVEENLSKQSEQLNKIRNIGINDKKSEVSYQQQLNDQRALLSVEKQRKDTIAETDKANANIHKANMDRLNAERTALQADKIAQQDLAQQRINAANIAKNATLEQANAIKRAAMEQKEASRQISLDNKRNAANAKVEAEIIKTAMMDRIANEKQAQAELKRTIAEINRLAKAYKAMPTLMTQQGINNIIAGSQGARSINQYLTAINNIKNAIKDLDTTDANYKQNLKTLNKELARLNKELLQSGYSAERVHKSHRNLMDISGQLQRRLALVFSVSQITGYMKQLVEVRGEFELQQKSLQVLLQNKDEANKLWQQTVNLAVKSPFRVGELVSYTRQLAAYRIETGKLFDTTKRLADVSAGLGVDMSRLILAYGQVRAANYLRGTELRQFTEAGIPMLDELAKRFTELEGRVVSAGDVFERISKRMVSFNDVEAVFRSMTDAGGTFYKMQEKQSETLKGMISNLHDTIDLMMNDLGKSQEGLLKGSVDLANSVVRNWRAWEMAIRDVAIAWGVLKVAQIIKAIRSIATVGIEATMALGGMNTVVAGLTKQLKDLWLVMSRHPLLMVAGAITTVVVILKQYLDLTRRINNELAKMDVNGLFDASKASSNYKRLAEAATDVTKSYDEQKAALDQLKREYSDMLPQQMLTIEGIKDLKGNYDSATRSIYEYIAAKTKERKIEFIESEYGKQLEDATTNMAKGIRKAIQDSLGDDVKINLSDLMPIVDQFRQGIEAGTISYGNMNEELAKLIKQHTGLSADIDDLNMSLLTSAGGMQRTFGNVESSATAFFNTVKRINNAINEVKGSTVAFGGLAVKQLDNVKAGYDKKLAEMKKAIDEIKLNPEDPKALDKLNKMFNEIGLKVPDWKKVVNDAFLLDKTTMEANKALYQSMIYSLMSQPMPYNMFPARSNYVERIEDELENIMGSEQQKEVKRLMLELSNTMNIPTTNMEKFFMDSSESISEYAKRIKGVYEDMVDGIKVYDQDLAQNSRLSPWTDEQYKRNKEQLPLVKAFLDYFKAFLDDSKSSTAKGKDWFAELAKNIKDANKEFVNLNQTFDSFTAKQTVLDKFKGVFGETLAALKAKGINIQLGDIDFTTEEGSIEALKMLKSKLPETARQSRLEVEKALSDIQGEVSIRVKKESDEKLKNDVQKLFDQYDLSVELQKINIPKDVAKQLFNIDVTDLDGLRKAVEAMKPQFQGTDMEKSYNEYLKKVTDLEAKAQLERSKTYVKYLLKSQSEAVKIKIEELRQIAEIQNKFDGEQAKYMMAGVRMESRQKLQRQQWKDFQNTDMYSAMFGDLENMSGRAIDLIYDKLNTLKQSLSDLPAEDVKEIMTQIKKLEEIKIARDPFGELKKSIQQIRALQQDGKTVAVLQDQLRASNEAVAAAQEQIDAIDLIANARDKDLLKQEMGVEWTEKYNRYLGMTSEELSASRDLQASILDKQDKVAQSAKEGLDVYSKQAKNLQNVSDKWNEVRNTFTDAASSLMDALVAAGVDADSTAMAFAQMGVDLVDVVMQSVQLGIQLQIVQYQAMLAGKAFNSMLGVIGWIAMALQGITKLFSAIFGAGDKRKQKQIENLQKQVENLSKAYDKLSESIDNAFSLDLMKTDARKANQNLQQRINKYNEMIALEEAKKKTDKDKIQDWRDEIASLQDEIAENNKKIVSTATDGILDDVLSASKSFTDAWLEAFQETGDGLTGLESEFKDMMQNLVKQQASMIITQQYVNSWKKSLEQFINPEDLELTTEEAKRWVSTVTNSLPQLNQALENYFNAMQQAGVDLSGESSGDKMSGLQRGIMGITAEQADILASYWNSTRFFVSNIDRNLAELKEHMMGGASSENPMLSQLKVIAAQTTAIYTLLNGLTRGGHRLGGMGLKIFMD